jgi:hypothetical protein
MISSWWKVLEIQYILYSTYFTMAFADRADRCEMLQIDSNAKTSPPAAPPSGNLPNASQARDNSGEQAFPL